ncbi:phage baseplate assembly protein V [Bradyrhizobium tropiciagri]|uniref:phage baseplate assembly protein V n=1 Tax=Bradyrhizobium tropiciagri TaxID=312253 RepID=UPI003D321CE8
MRVKASVPAVLGAQTSGWARPCTPFAGPNMGFAFLPDVAPASGSSSRAATCPFRSGSAAIGTMAISRRMRPRAYARS